MIKYIILEKAKPYTRYRRGRIERVRGYTGKPSIVVVGGLPFKQTDSQRKWKEEVVLVDVARFDANWSKDKDYYISSSGIGKIGNRLENFKEFLKTGQTIEMPSVSVRISERGPHIGFSNGRHRFAVLRDMGLKTVPISVDGSSVKLAKKLFESQSQEQEKSKELQHLRDFSQIGPQLGSQPGGLFKERSTDKKWYIKKPPTEEHARNEKLTADLYQIAGIQVPKVKLIEVPVMHVKDWGFDKGLGVASEWIEGLKESPEELKKNPIGLADGFAVDAWLANWDVVGTAWDNILLDATGHAIRVDTGGGLKYRARGESKKLDDTVSEWDSMRTKHHPSAEVFGKLTDNELINSGRKVMAISDSEIRRVVADNGFGKNLADLLIARKNVIGTKVFSLLRPDQESKKGVTFYVIDLEKAKPYTRYRRGRLERVKGYQSKDKKPTEIKIHPAWGEYGEIEVKVDEWKKILANKEALEKVGFKYTGRDQVIETRYVEGEKKFSRTAVDVLETKAGNRILIAHDDPPSNINEDLTYWGTIFEFSKKWPLPDVFYPGRHQVGDKFAWESRSGLTAEGETAGFADYINNRIVVFDDHKGWWIFSHEMGHFVLNRLVKMDDPKRKEAEKLVASLGGGLQFVEGGSKNYNKGIEVLKSLEIPLNDPVTARKMVEDLVYWDKIWKPGTVIVGGKEREVIGPDLPFKSREDVLKAYHDQGLEMYGNGYGVVTALLEKIKEGKPLELTKDEEKLLDKYGKLLDEMKTEVTLFTDWDKIYKEENFKSGNLDKKMDAYADRNMGESFAEFYQLFTMNLFNLPKHDAVQPAWEGLQVLKKLNPRKFKFFVDNVFGKEYKAFRKVAIAHMKYVKEKTSVTGN